MRGYVGTRLSPSGPLAAVVRFTVVLGAAISFLAVEFQARVVPMDYAVSDSQVTRPSYAFEPLAEAFL